MIPLSNRLRPKTLKDFVGQRHLLSQDKLLFESLKNKKIFSMILWGPPGVGKTTIARIIAYETKSEFLEFSAVNTGIAEVKKIIEGVKNKHVIASKAKQSSFEFEIATGSSNPRNDEGVPIVFIDEIHRFNKAQQDAFLPLVETGQIILIGATTENPSFEIISPLLSRSRVLVLEPLSEDDLSEIMKRGLKELGVKIDKKSKDLLMELSGGDARVLLNTLEIAAGLNENIGVEEIEEAFQKKALMYDKAGEEHYNTISAFIKSMRASNVDSALYYLARMVSSGEDALFIARRMVIFASEDIGQAQPTALVVANEVFKACETIGYPECQINLAHGVVYLCNAKKDRSSYDAYFKALEDVKKYGNLPIPKVIRNAPTKLMKELNYGKGYDLPTNATHQALQAGKYTKEDLLPEKLKGKKYYIPKVKE